MNKNYKNGSNSEKLRMVQAELNGLHSAGKLNVKYKVLGIEMVTGKGLVVKLKCVSCSKAKTRKMAHIRNNPSKGGCLCYRTYTKEEIKEMLQQKLGPQYQVKKVYRKRTTSKRAKHAKSPFHAYVYDKKWQCTHRDLNVNNILNKGTLPMTAKMIHEDEIRERVESKWPTLKVKFVSRLLWETKMGYFQNLIYPFVRCIRCGEEYFKRYSKSKKATRTFCCGLGGTTGKRQDFINKCKRNGGKGLLYFCYLRHPLGFEYIKQGITSELRLKERMRSYKKEKFSEVIVYKTFMGDAGEIYDMEQRLLNDKPFVKTMVKFDGCSECYEWDVIPKICTKKDREYVRKWRGKIRSGKTKRSWSNFVEFLGDEKRHQVGLRWLKA
ncbi:hypothetical protein [Ekhidna sp.]|jgi:hypothetical protein|uniref:hypothetical protein n=1 Tax=Ekhidna sp. TaxID=2608089 RepID=UPI0032EAF46F